MSSADLPRPDALSRLPGRNPDVIEAHRCDAAHVYLAARNIRRDLTAMPVPDCLMANHPQPREHDVSHDQEEDDLKSPISAAARSAATVAAPAASTPATSVSAMSAVSASNTASTAASTAVHHDEIARVPGRRRAGATYEFPEDGHGRMQTAGARALWAPWFKSRHHAVGVVGTQVLEDVPSRFPREARGSRVAKALLGKDSFARLVANA